MYKNQSYITTKSKSKRPSLRARAVVSVALTTALLLAAMPLAAWGTDSSAWKVGAGLTSEVAIAQDEQLTVKDLPTQKDVSTSEAEEDKSSGDGAIGSLSSDEAPLPVPDASPLPETPVAPSMPQDASPYANNPYPTEPVIVAPTASGTCTWSITTAIVEGETYQLLNIYPTEGVSGTLADWGVAPWGVPPWLSKLPTVDGVRIGSGVKALSCTKMFDKMGSRGGKKYNSDFSNLDTSNVTDMSSMFNSCSSLTSLDLSSFDTSNVTNMNNMFNYCGSLTSLNFSSFDTTNVTDMGYMFSGCKSLTSLDLSSLNTTKVTDMGSMFNSCSSLTSLNVSSLNTTNATNMKSMFSSCSSLTSLDLSSLNTTNVTDMGYMFSGCKSFTSLNVSSLNTTNATNMNNMFSSCSSLTSLDLSSFITTKVTNMSSMFYNSYSLTSLDLSSFSTTNVTNMSKMFDSCSSLTSLDLSSFNTTKVTTMGEMFNGCYDLTSLDLSSLNTTKVTNMNDMFKNCRSLTSLDLSSFNTANVTDMREMFYYCNSLASLDLSSFDTTKVTDMSRMFESCSSLTSLNVSSFDTANVTTMVNMFNGCSSLTSLNVSSFDTGKVTTMERMFGGCRSLASLDTSSFNTTNVTNMLGMFSGCNSLTSLNLLSFNTTKVTTMSQMFRSCASLTSLDLSSFNTTKVTTMSEMFSECGSLTSLDLSSFDTAKVTDMDSMFRNGYRLVSLNVSSFDTANVTDMDSMFRSCKSLTSLDLSSFTISSTETKVDVMLAGLSSLTEITLSSTMKIKPSVEYDGVREAPVGYKWMAVDALNGGSVSTPMGAVFEKSIDLTNYHHSRAALETYVLSTNYTVVFDANGGVFLGGDTAISQKISVVDGKAVRPSPPPENGNFVLGGWYADAASASGTKWNFSNPVTKNMRLYAGWSSGSPFAFTKKSAVDDTPLANAEFKLFVWAGTGAAPAPSALTPIDPSAPPVDWMTVETITSDSAGFVGFSDALLTGGTYLLAETRAPSGYQLPAGQWMIEVSAATEAKSPFKISAVATPGQPLPPALTAVAQPGGGFAYSLYNLELFDLPYAGCTGVAPYLSSGLGLFALTVLMGMIFFVRRGRRDAS